VKKRSNKLLTLMITLALSTLAAAQKCTVNGEEVPCDQFWDQFGALFAGMGVVWLLIMGAILITIAISLVFWLWMLIDCLKRDFKDKIPWLAVIILGNTLGAILYYILVKRKGN
jgi:hypothetical protein